jgi:hypothetical protein
MHPFLLGVLHSVLHSVFAVDQLQSKADAIFHEEVPIYLLYTIAKSDLSGDTRY